MAYSTNVRVHTLYRQHATMATHKHATHCTLPRASHHEQLPLVLCLTTPWGSATATLVPDHSGGGKGRGGDTSVQARWGQGEGKERTRSRVGQTNGVPRRGSKEQVTQVVVRQTEVRPAAPSRGVVFKEIEYLQYSSSTLPFINFHCPSIAVFPILADPVDLKIGVQQCETVSQPSI